MNNAKENTENYKSGHTLALEKMSQRPYFEKHSFSLLQTASVSASASIKLQQYIESTILPSLRKKDRLKVCVHCNEEKYLTEFGVTTVLITPIDRLHRALPDNTSDRCLDCLTKIIGKDFYMDDKERETND